MLKQVLADSAVEKAVSLGPPQKAAGLLMKAFFERVDRAMADSQLVRERALAALEGKS